MLLNKCYYYVLNKHKVVQNDKILICKIRVTGFGMFTVSMLESNHWQKPFHIQSVFTQSIRHQPTGRRNKLSDINLPCLWWAALHANIGIHLNFVTSLNLWLSVKLLIPGTRWIQVKADLALQQKSINSIVNTNFATVISQ